MSDHSALSEDRRRDVSAQVACDALRDRILAYFAKHHPDSELGRRARLGWPALMGAGR